MKTIRMCKNSKSSLALTPNDFKDDDENKSEIPYNKKVYELINLIIDQLPPLLSEGITIGYDNSEDEKCHYIQLQDMKVLDKDDEIKTLAKGSINIYNEDKFELDYNESYYGVGFKSTGGVHYRDVLCYTRKDLEDLGNGLSIFKIQIQKSYKEFLEKDESTKKEPILVGTKSVPQGRDEEEKPTRTIRTRKRVFKTE